MSLKFNAVTYRLPNRPVEARQKLESVIVNDIQTILGSTIEVDGIILPTKRRVYALKATTSL